MSSRTKAIALTQYLYGSSQVTRISEMWDARRETYLPVQSSPLKEYVHDVNRFLFSGGINININELPENHYAHEFINYVANKYIHPNLFPIWELLALTGELLTVVRIKNGKPSFEFFDPREYSLVTVNNKVTQVKIRTIVELEGKRYIYRFEVTPFNYVEYPLVLEEKEANYEWDKVAEFVNHGFKRIPINLIGLNKNLTNKRGNPEFNWGSLMLAKSIATIEYGLDENVYFFGNPLIDSPDPDKTTKDLNAKKQVLQKLPPDEGGGHELLQPQALSETELNYLKIKKESFKRSMGITNTQETQLNDASGVALRIMNDGLISKAQSKWEEIVTYGLEDLLDLVLQLAQDLGILSLGVHSDKSLITIARSEPYFIRTEDEKLKSLDVAERLIELGIDRAIALQETYYSHKSIQEIELLFRPNLEDV
jgi:hypothetical protein